MLNIGQIEEGFVLDHIKAGQSLDIYYKLGLDKINNTVAIIKNVRSNKMGKKDIIKIDDTLNLNLDVLGYIDPDITVCYIKDSKIVEKRHLELPSRLVNVIRCKNPRCITSTDTDLDQIFRLTDPEHGVYRCAYCESRKSSQKDY